MDGGKIIRVSLVEDDNPVRESLAVLIDGSPGFSVFHSCGRADEAIRRIPQDPPDVVLMDIRMPRMSGIECTRQLRGSLPELKVIMLTTVEDEDQLFEALRAGACGYLLKRTPPATILEAIEEAQGGESPISGKMARLLVNFFNSGKQASPALPKISEREREILDALSEGLRNKEIGARLHVSENTVRAHLRTIYEKLQVGSRAEAVAKYLGQQEG